MRNSVFLNTFDIDITFSFCYSRIFGALVWSVISLSRHVIQYKTDERQKSKVVFVIIIIIHAFLGVEEQIPELFLGKKSTRISRA